MLVSITAHQIAEDSRVRALHSSVQRPPHYGPVHVGITAHAAEAAVSEGAVRQREGELVFSSVLEVQ